MVRCRHMFLLPISIYKQLMSNIKPPQETDYNISKYSLPPLNHPKISTVTENYHSLSRALRVILAKDTIINSSTAPKLPVKIVTYMNNDNRFYLLVAVVFSVSPQLGGIGPKDQDLLHHLNLQKLNHSLTFS